MAAERWTLAPDRRGVVWDALLYLPTCLGLLIAAFSFWYKGNSALTYLLLFLGSFFLLQGAHRILGRLMLLPSAPVAIDVSKQRVIVETRNGKRAELVKGVRFYPDYAGKSFGLVGMDLSGARRQFVFHRGQFSQSDEFKRISASLKVYA
jgi:hypothetical protein